MSKEVRRFRARIIFSSSHFLGSCRSNKAKNNSNYVYEEKGQKQPHHNSWIKQASKFGRSRRRWRSTKLRWRFLHLRPIGLPLRSTSQHTRKNGFRQIWRRNRKQTKQVACPIESGTRLKFSVAHFNALYHDRLDWFCHGSDERAKTFSPAPRVVPFWPQVFSGTYCHRGRRQFALGLRWPECPTLLFLFRTWNTDPFSWNYLSRTETWRYWPLTGKNLAKFVLLLNKSSLHLAVRNFGMWNSAEDWVPFPVCWRCTEAQRCSDRQSSAIPKMDRAYKRNSCLFHRREFLPFSEHRHHGVTAPFFCHTN